MSCRPSLLFARLPYVQQSRKQARNFAVSSSDSPAPAVIGVTLPFLHLRVSSGMRQSNLPHSYPTRSHTLESRLPVLFGHIEYSVAFSYIPSIRPQSSPSVTSKGYRLRLTTDYFLLYFFNSRVMIKETNVPEPHALYPLTSFDTIYGNCGIVVGWFVEGLIDIDKLDAALTRLVRKWPLLAGRLECKYEKRRDFSIRIPLGPLHPGYEPYVLTSSVSEHPISHYVELPLAAISNVLPSSLFKIKDTPHTTPAWAETQRPLTFWHVTHFLQPGQEYSCIGVTFSHGLLDGIGISLVIHALEAEMLGKDWEVPPLPHRGLNENKMQTRMNEAVEEASQKSDLAVDYRAACSVGWWFVITFLWWHLWQYYWHKVETRMIMVPPKAYNTLVSGARKALAGENKSEVRLSTGDVLAAWLLKTVYSDGTKPDTLVHLSNMASLRSFFNAELSRYPHNCFVPIAYPAITVGELNKMSISSIAYILWEARSSLSISHAVKMHHIIEDATETGRSVLPFDEQADESMTMSNMSVARIVDINWTGVGGGKTLCRYKSLVSDNPITISNLITIAGRTHDGSTVLDVVLNKRRMERLEQEVNRLISETK